MPTTEIVQPGTRRTHKLKPMLEAVPFEILEFSEIEEDGEKRLKVSGVCQSADERNANGRIYPYAVLEREIGTINQRIANGEDPFAQADHPTDGRSTIQNTAAIWKKFSLDPSSKRVTGECVVLNTAVGRDLQEIIRAGARIGISARGFGTMRQGKVNEVEGEIVQDDYRLVTYDFVIGQSHKGAVVTSFAEQAQLLGGQLDMEETMELTALQLTQLKEARPDLVKAIEDAVRATAEADVLKNLTAEALTTARPDIAEAMKKKKDNTDPAANCNDDETQEQALRAFAEKKGLVLIAKDSGDAKIESDLAAAKQQLTEVTSSLTTKLEQLATQVVELREGAEKAKVFEYVQKKTQGETFRAPLMEALNACTTVAEVEAKFASEKARIERIVSEAIQPKGKGHAQSAEPQGSGAAEGDKKLKVKTASGTVLELTEAQVKMQRAAGLMLEAVNA